MGKIALVFAGMFLLTACLGLFDNEYSCPPDYIGSDTYLFQKTGNDTLRVGESIRFQVTRLNPKIQQLVTSERLPYPPTAELLIDAISDTIPPFATSPKALYTYSTKRPFRIITTPGLSAYSGDGWVSVKGEFIGDSIKFDFQLRALSAGLYKISWVSYSPVDAAYGTGMVHLDAKTYRCGYFWRMVPEFETNQSFEPYTLAYPGLEPGEKRLNRFVYVLP